MCNWIDTDYSRSYAIPSHIFTDCSCVHLAEKVTKKLFQESKLVVNYLTKKFHGIGEKIMLFR